MAALYAGNLDRAEAINDSYELVSPTRRAWHHYTRGEIAGRRGDWTSAEMHYRIALNEVRSGGPSFIAGVTTVGLLSAQVASGQHQDALQGYLELLEHYERTGAWNFQWTTLRNVADLVDILGEAELAVFLRDVTSRSPVLSVDVSDIAGPNRSDVITAARAGIADLLAKGQWQTSGSGALPSTAAAPSAT